MADAESAPAGEKRGNCHAGRWPALLPGFEDRAAAAQVGGPAITDSSGHFAIKFRWCCGWWPWWWFRCLSPSRAQQVFDAMSGTSCAPLTVIPPCIPFASTSSGYLRMAVIGMLIFREIEGEETCSCC